MTKYIYLYVFDDAGHDGDVAGSLPDTGSARKRVFV